jgi:hypothetical protein
LFTLIGFAHVNDAAICAAQGPDHNHHALIKQAGSGETDFAVVLATVFAGEIHAGKNGRSIGEVKARSASVLSRLASSKDICMDLLYVQ